MTFQQFYGIWRYKKKSPYHEKYLNMSNFLWCQLLIILQALRGIISNDMILSLDFRSMHLTSKAKKHKKCWWRIEVNQSVIITDGIVFHDNRDSLFSWCDNQKDHYKENWKYFISLRWNFELSLSRKIIKWDNGPIFQFDWKELLNKTLELNTKHFERWRNRWVCNYGANLIIFTFFNGEP